MSPYLTARAVPTLRTVFISDVHLGFRGCQAEYLLDFLTQFDAEQLVLVGDILDLWSLKRSLYWPVAHQEVVKAILRIVHRGARVVYVPGNHDEEFRELCGATLGGIEIRRDFIHETADGRRFLVLHGDDFDAAVKFSGLLKGVGERFYDLMLWLGRGVQWLRRRFGFGYWSLATWVKQKIPDARLYIARFESAAAHAAARYGLDGVICGHIHRPEIRDVDGIQYCNAGDWVEHCSALVEHRNGQLEILEWADRATSSVSGPVAAAAPLPATLDRAA